MTNIEWFSDLASSPDVAARFDSTESARLNEFVAVELVDCSLPTISTAQDFESAIKILSQNKRNWSNRLSRLIIELHAPTDAEAARDELRQFAEGCPWRYLREAAQGSL